MNPFQKHFPQQVYGADIKYKNREDYLKYMSCSSGDIWNDEKIEWKWKSGKSIRTWNAARVACIILVVITHDL